MQRIWDISVRTEFDKKTHTTTHEPVTIGFVSGGDWESGKASTDMPSPFLHECVNTPRDIAKATRKLIVFPAVGSRLLTLIDKPESNLEDFTDVLCQDVSLSSAVLRLSNSGAHYTSTSITDIQSALNRIGLNNLRGLIVSLSLPGACAELVNPIIDLKDFWNGSLRSATIASSLAAHMGSVDVSEAFTAGLMLDLGQLVLFQQYPERSDQVLELFLRDDTQTICSAEKQIFGFDHQAMGKALAELWNFPEKLVDCISSHHSNPTETSGQPLSDIIHLAVLFAHTAELNQKFNVLEKEIFLKFRDRLFINEEFISIVFNDAHSLYDQLKESLISPAGRTDNKRSEAL